MSNEVQKEYRAAVVFYGGVSLAVYENGVARAFFDACRGRGAFAPLLQLLRGRFVVDVVSGSSAGGINGLLLAAALEHGSEFSQTAKLWREAGGFDNLLRPVSEADRAPSLLRGETYYLEQLRQAFRQLCTGGCAASAPKEIDVYVTGTDLTGQRRELLDDVGSCLETRDHRLVFHLKHRRQRAALGLVHDAGLSGEQELQLQSDILASVSRITSSFPGAFPPFTVDELRPRSDDRQPVSDVRARVSRALQHLANAPLGQGERQHALIDGGVLDNKPFGPVLDSIFHRLPSERGLSVDRKLYYVEPDPVPFEQRFRFTPLQVLLEALGPLPMYDSIAADLRCLKAHNGRVRRYRMLRECALRAVHAGLDAEEAERHQYLYRVTLRQSIACMLLGIAPNDANAAEDLDRALGSMSDWFEQIAPTSPREPLRWHERDLDIALHLRRAYYVLYAENATGQRVVGGDARYSIGRIIKALKLLRDVWLSQLRSLAGAPSPHAGDAAAAPAPLHEACVEHRLPILRSYLAGEWIDAHDLQALLTGGACELTSERLQRLRLQALEWLKLQLAAGSTPDPAVNAANRPPHAPPANILDWLDAQLRTCVPDPAPDSGQLHVVDEFERIDPCVYPAEFAAELYELDEVRVVRISPKDARVPGVRVRDKITGDELAHFSAFLRKDWRTNDLAWGHVDGLCQIVRALLPDTACDAVAHCVVDQHKTLGAAFSKPALRAQFEALLEATQRDKIAVERLTVDRIAGLDDACERLERAFTEFSAWAHQSERDTTRGQQLLGALREAWLSAASIEAMGEYVGWIVTDTEYQNRQWRWATGPQRTIERESNALTQVAAMNLGGRAINEELPDSLTVQYGGHVGLLLWGMVDGSLRAKGRTTALLKRAGKTLRPLLWSAYYIARSVRVERRFAGLVMLAGVVGGLAFALGSGLAGASGYATLSLLVVLWFVYLAYTLSQPKLDRAVKVTAFTVLLGLGVGARFHPTLGHWCGDRIIDAGRWLQDEVAPAQHAAEPASRARALKPKHEQE